MLDFLLGEGPTWLKFVVAFVVVLVLIGLTTWLLRRYSGERLGASAARGRQPRLAVIDAASVDGRRRLLLIRRDSVEHLVMIGGATDVVIESGIVRSAASVRETQPARGPTAAEIALRAGPPLEGSGSPLQPLADRPAVRIEPVPAARPELSLRAPRAPVRDERETPAAESAAPATPTVPPAASSAGVSDPLVSLAAEFSRLPVQPEPPPLPPRPARDREPPRMTAPKPPLHPPPPLAPPEPAASDPAATTDADQSLAEIAQQLEAALRRPKKPDTRAEPTMKPPPVPAPDADREMHDVAESTEAVAPKVASAEPIPAPAKRAREPRSPSSGSLYDSLEQEMASLLGRTENKT